MLRVSKKEKNARIAKSSWAIFNEIESKKDLFIDERDRGENLILCFSRIRHCQSEHVWCKIESATRVSIKFPFVKSCFELTVSFCGFYIDWVTVPGF